MSLELKIRFIYDVICITCYSYSGFEVVGTIQCVQSSWSIYCGYMWSHSIYSSVLNANPQLYKSGAHKLALQVQRSNKTCKFIRGTVTGHKQIESLLSNFMGILTFAEVRILPRG